MKVSYKNASLTANGGTNGVLTVASTTGFVKEATVFLGASGLPTVELQIAAIDSDTALAVKLKSSASARYNCGLYTTALGSYIVQPDQEIFPNPPTRATAYDLSAHTEANTGVHGLGITGAVVGTTDTQTLTNKTISGASNTLSNVPNSATTATTAATPNTIVLRDNDGNVAAVQGGFSGALSAASASITNTVAAATLTASTATQSPKYKPTAAGQGMIAEASVTSGSGTVPFTIENTLAFNGGADKLFSAKQNGSEAAYITGQGQVVAVTNFQSNNGYILCPGATMNVRGGQPDGATAVATALRSGLNLITTGAKVTGFYNNNTTEVLAVTKDGDLQFNGISAALFGYNNISDQFTTNGKTLNTSNGTDGNLVADSVSTTGDALGTSAYLYGNIYTEGDLQMNGGNIDVGGMYVYNGILASADAGAVADAGRIRMLKNEGVAWRNNGDAGNNVLTTGAADDFLYYNGVKVVTETPTFLASISPKTRVKFIPMEDWRVGATAPGHATYGSNPRKSGWEYTAVGAGNQEMEMFVGVPDDIDINYPVKIDLSVLLESAETVGDTCDFSVQYVAFQTAPTGSGSSTGTATTATGRLEVVTGKTAAGTVYDVSIELDPTDATNPFSGDNYHIAFGLKRTAGAIGGVLVLGACMKYTSKI